jgi:hypothetical protein
MPSEGVWMGWERKRGKLVELSDWLSGATTSSYVLADPGTPLPPIRYVITLDADSLLTRGGARRLIATLAHPLNQAAFDPQSGALIAGYTVLQPRVRVKPSSVNRTILTRLFAGDLGLDLYTQTVSDVYQDLFQEGIYVGKGIMDVAAFHRSLEGASRRMPRFPRPVRGASSGGAGLVGRRRCPGELPGSLSGLGRTPASLDARRLAAAAMADAVGAVRDRQPDPKRLLVARPLEDPRQHAPQSAGSVAPGVADCRLAVAPRPDPVLDPGRRPHTRRLDPRRPGAGDTSASRRCRRSSGCARCGWTWRAGRCR